ncbi:MAG TPA: hypothetical protein VI796_00505, partial [Candidatus Thermoplasmatota archaeon]|nr:hypothetical protein [Candidatus Thermoplasmatota archaeon]
GYDSSDCIQPWGTVKGVSETLALDIVGQKADFGPMVWTWKGLTFLMDGSAVSYTGPATGTGTATVSLSGQITSINLLEFLDGMGVPFVATLQELETADEVQPYVDGAEELAQEHMDNLVEWAGAIAEGELSVTYSGSGQAHSEWDSATGNCVL